MKSLNVNVDQEDLQKLIDIAFFHTSELSDENMQLINRLQSTIGKTKAPLSIEDVVKARGHKSKIKTVFKTLCQHGVNKEWSCSDLSRESKVAVSAVHKLKYKLATLNILEGSGQGLKFKLTDYGHSQILPFCNADAE